MFVIKNCVICLFFIVEVFAQIPFEELDSIFQQKDCVEASTFSTPLIKTSEITTYDNNVEENSIQIGTLNISLKNAMLHINEISQHNNLKYKYKLLSEEGPAHNKKYIVSLKLGDEKYTGTGSSLKAAQQMAAFSAISNTMYDIPEKKLQIDEALTPTVLLNNIGLKLGLKIEYEQEDCNKIQFSSGGGGKMKRSYYEKLNATMLETEHLRQEASQNKGPFCVSVEVDDQEFHGKGHTLQSAKHKAATNALEELKKKAFFNNDICSVDESSDSCRKKREALKSPISRIYEIGQKNNMAVDFEVIKEEGKSHKKIFTIQCKVGEYVTIGEGTSKKEAKRLAAELMLEELPEEFLNLVSENEIVNNLKPKKNKKKKKKSLKKFDQNALDSVMNMLNMFVPSSEDDSENNEMIGHEDKKQITSSSSKTDMKRKSNSQMSPKSKMLEVSNKLKFEVQFQSLGKHKKNFYGVANLGIKPPYICLGKHPLEEVAFDEAAKRGLKFLSKSGLMEELSYNQKITMESLYLDEWLKFAEAPVILKKDEKHDEL